MPEFDDTTFGDRKPVTVTMRDDTAECPECGGAGSMLNEVGDGMVEVLPCPACDGTGDLHRPVSIDTAPIPVQPALPFRKDASTTFLDEAQAGARVRMAQPIVFPEYAQPAAIDVTDALTPGARALVRERSEAVQRITDGLRATVATEVEARARELTASLREHVDRVFRMGRAYERGAKVRTLVGKTLEQREAKAREVAREYLDDDDLPVVLRRELAAVVLAGFTGTDPTSMYLAAVA